MKRRVHERRSLLNNYSSPSDKQREDYLRFPCEAWYLLTVESGASHR